MVNNCQLRLPSQIYFGEGSVQYMKDILEAEKSRNVSILTYEDIRSTGLLDLLLPAIEESGANVNIYCDVVPEPSYMQVQKAVDWLNEKETDLIVAIGGGSVIDTAKLCSLLAGSSNTVHDLLQNPGQVRKSIKTVMIPTTCGTGAEATGNAIVLVPEKSVKLGIVNMSSVADYVILDVNMIRKLPPRHIAATGVDAMAHVVECYTSNKATPLSDLYAKEGAKCLFHSIRTAFHEADNMEAKSQMLLGAFYGGVSIAGSGTTAVHALSYPLGGTYHVAHGVSNAVLFAEVMRFNMPYCEERIAELCAYVYPEKAALSVSERANFMVDEIADIVKEVEIPTSLKDFGITSEALDDLIAGAMEQQRLLVNNPVELTEEDIRNIYLKLL